MYNFINNMNTNRNVNLKGSSIKPNNLNRGKPPLPINGSKTISLFSQPYLDTYNQCYKTHRNHIYRRQPYRQIT